MVATAIGLSVSVFVATGAYAASTSGSGLNVAATPSVPVNVTQSSTTNFTLSLAKGATANAAASCSADNTAPQGEVVLTYLAAAGQSITGLTYTGSNLFPDQANALTNPNSWVAQSFPGLGSGLVTTNPLGNIQFSGLIGQGVALSGSTAGGAAIFNTGSTTQLYHGGVLCYQPAIGTAAPVVTDYFDACFTFTETTADPGGNGFEWAYTPCTGGIVPEFSKAVALPIGGALAIAGTLFVSRRRRRTRGHAVAVS
jgi:hypothetical protein